MNFVSVILFEKIKRERKKEKEKNPVSNLNLKRKKII
jgi:hypothetical protein